MSGPWKLTPCYFGTSPGELFVKQKKKNTEYHKHVSIECHRLVDRVAIVEQNYMS